ncbi:MAG: isoprenylcysteine carboxylmethyltransferase family protein [Candidatus Aenigmarchaeota archaeon]|nr:isoprenylcysteine carboxylmethyltransferase family protein [Candidatus Aenigmarchaeota archaeon]
MPRFSRPRKSPRHQYDADCAPDVNKKTTPKIMPPAYFAFLLLLAIALHFSFPAPSVFYPPWNYIGAALILLGIILNLWSDQLFRKKQTTVKPHEVPSTLVTTGPFRISRHPMYLGMMLILLGTAVFLGSLSSLIAPAAFILITETWFIPMEERNLERKFGTDYSGYRKRVRRWI